MDGTGLSLGVYTNNTSCNADEIVITGTDWISLRIFVNLYWMVAVVGHLG